MSQVLLARITCPSCQNQFQVPIEEILDVRTDPNAKMRVLNGLVNVAVCPNCGMRGALNMPFLYHDPDKELALIYMPMEAGRDDLERQQAIGRLTSRVMNRLPPEERKGYLLQPQVYFTLETLVNKVLEADGVTPEMLEQQRARAELLQRMLEAPSDEALTAMIQANDAVIDSRFLRLLALNLEMAEASGQADGVQRLLMLREKLLELSSEGQVIMAQGEMLEALQAEPTRENLLNLLIQAPDERTRTLLVTFGRPLLDYPFFQALTSRIDSASEKEEQERLIALRQEILAARDRLDQEARALYEARAALLRDLLLSDDPETLARRRSSELDQVFLDVLTNNLREAQSMGNQEVVKALQAIWNLVMGLMEEMLPPAIRLVNRLLLVEDEAGVEKLLEENRDLVTEELANFIEEARTSLWQDGGDSEAVERLALVLEKVRGMVAETTVA